MLSDTKQNTDNMIGLNGVHIPFALNYYIANVERMLKSEIRSEAENRNLWNEFKYVNN